MGDSANIIQFLANTKNTISIVESCSGGLLNYEFSKISGASNVYRGGIISYQNEIKQNVLGIDKEILEEKTAYSFEVLSLMLDGILKMMKSDFAIATSGIAGPSGGTIENPIGSVYIGVKKRGENAVMKKYHFKGSRLNIQKSTVKSALVLFTETFIV